MLDVSAQGNVTLPDELLVYLKKITEFMYLGVSLGTRRKRALLQSSIARGGIWIAQIKDFREEATSDRLINVVSASYTNISGFQTT